MLFDFIDFSEADAQSDAAVTADTGLKANVEQVGNGDQAGRSNISDMASDLISRWKDLKVCSLLTSSDTEINWKYDWNQNSCSTLELRVYFLLIFKVPEAIWENSWE